MGFHYEKKIEFKKKTLKELFEILNLAEMYQTKELHDKVNGLIKDFPLNIENVVEVAASTQEFSQFENLSKNLYARCVAFIEKDCIDVQSFLTFVQGNDDKSTVMTLLQDIKTTKSSSKSESQEQGSRSGSKAQQQFETCSNCKQKPCRKGEMITYYDPLENGMLLRTTNDWLPRGGTRWSNLLCLVVGSSAPRTRFVVSWGKEPSYSWMRFYEHNESDFNGHFSKKTRFMPYVYACDQ